MYESQNSPCRAVTFDLDGLLFNTETIYVEVGDTILRRRGHRFTRELIDQMMGLPTPLALQRMIEFHRLDATPEELQAEGDALFPELLDRQLAPMPGAVELLDAVEAAGIPRGIGTSSRRHIVDLIMERTGWRDRFSFILTAEDIARGKPAPDIYLHAASLHEIDPPEMLVLEDSAQGSQAAVAAGSYAVAVPGAHSRHQPFPPVRFIADSLLDPRIWRLLDLVPPRGRASDGAGHSTSRPDDTGSVE